MAEPEIVERSRSHFLTRDDDGFALWGTDQDGDDPLLTFTPDAAGKERALSAFRLRSRETAWVRRLGVSAFVGAAGYVGTNLGELVIGLLQSPIRREVVRESMDRIDQILFVVENLAFAVMIASVGCCIVVWLQRRWRREG